MATGGVDCRGQHLAIVDIGKTCDTIIPSMLASLIIDPFTDDFHVVQETATGRQITDSSAKCQYLP